MLVSKWLIKVGDVGEAIKNFREKKQPQTKSYLCSIRLSKNKKSYQGCERQLCEHIPQLKR